MRSKESILSDISNESKVTLSKLRCIEGWSPSTQNRWIEVTIDGTDKEIDDVADAMLHVIPIKYRPVVNKVGDYIRRLYINELY